jgi:hypothetical protein
VGENRHQTSNGSLLARNKDFVRGSKFPARASEGHARSLSNGHHGGGQLMGNNNSRGPFFPAHHSATGNLYGDRHSFASSSASSSSGRRNNKKNGHAVR